MGKTRKERIKEKRFVQIVVLVSLIILVVIVVFTVREVNIWPDKMIAKIEKQIELKKYAYSLELIDEVEERISDISVKKYKDECNYNIAIDTLNNGNIKKARYQFKVLEGYADSKKMINECDYQQASIILENGDFSSALIAFSSLSEYKDSDDKILLCRYEIASATLDDGNIVLALERFQALEN